MDEEAFRAAGQTVKVLEVPAAVHTSRREKLTYPLPASKSFSIRSRTVSRPDSCCRPTRSSPPIRRASSSRRRSSSSSGSQDTRPP